MNTRHAAHGGAQSGAPEGRGGRPGIVTLSIGNKSVEIDGLAILDQLTDEQVSTVYRLTTDVFAQVWNDYGRILSAGELRDIMQKITRFILAPNAASFSVQ